MRRNGQLPLFRDTHIKKTLIPALNYLSGSNWVHWSVSIPRTCKPKAARRTYVWTQRACFCLKSCRIWSHPSRGSQYNYNMITGHFTPKTGIMIFHPQDNLLHGKPVTFAGLDGTFFRYILDTDLELLRWLRGKDEGQWEKKCEDEGLWMIHSHRCECVGVWESERDGSPRVKAESICQRPSRKTLLKSWGGR